jgi:flagellar export protein FliJ
MRKALATLLRVRDVGKKQARQAFGEAERARIAQEGAVSSIEQAIVASQARAQDLDPGLPAHWYALEHEYRIRKVEELNEARVRLDTLATESARRREVLTEASREARVVEAALESYDERAAKERRQADGRKIDAMATTRWWRDNS